MSQAQKKVFLLHAFAQTLSSFCSVRLIVKLSTVSIFVNSMSGERFRRFDVGLDQPQSFPQALFITVGNEPPSLAKSFSVQMRPMSSTLTVRHI